MRIRRRHDAARSELARLRGKSDHDDRARRDAERAAERATDDLDRSIKQLEQINEELIRALEMRDRLISATVGELMLPMASVNQLSSSLERRWADITDDKRRLYVAMIDQQAARAARYVRDLVVVAQVGTSALEVRVEPVALPHLVASVVDQLLPEGAERTVSCPAHAEVLADERHVRRVLEALLRNAERHGEPPYELTVAFVGSEVEIVVADHGPGVRPEFVERLFEPFTTAETVEPGTASQAGIGLAIARHLTRLQDGTLTFTPGTPTGSRFTVRLPAA